MIPFAISISSCGYDLRETYPGDAYNSPIFSNNYYRVYDDRINPDKDNSIEDVKEFDLNGKDYVYKTYADAKNGNIDPDMNKIIEYEKPDGTKGQYDGLRYVSDTNENYDYGPNKKMNSKDSIFKYGYLSKLYDGQMFCNGYYQLARVQIDERGFGVIYDKELIDSDYIALSFKASVDYTQEVSVPLHDSSVNLHITFYERDGAKFHAVKTTCQFDNLRTNDHEAFDRGNYVFYAFKLSELNLSRVCGYSISFELLSDQYVTDYNYDYSLMFYEVFFPNSSWR
jgi:hypothetical protein